MRARSPKQCIVLLGLRMCFATCRAASPRTINMPNRQHARREDEHDGDHQQRARARRAARPQCIARAQLVGDARADLNRAEGLGHGTGFIR